MDYTIASNNPELFSAILEPLGGKTVKKDGTSGPLESNCHLAVGADIAQSPTVSSLKDSIKPGGFLLLEESADISDSAVKAIGLELVAKIKSELRLYLLLRKVRIVNVIVFYYHKI